MFNSSLPSSPANPTKTLLTATKGGASGQVGPVRADNCTWWRARSQHETGQVLALPLALTRPRTRGFTSFHLHIIIYKKGDGNNLSHRDLGRIHQKNMRCEHSTAPGKARQMPFMIVIELPSCIVLGPMRI